MATQSRQTKGNRKPGPEPAAARRAPAWGSGARASPTFSPGPPRQQQSSSPASPASFPPLAQPNGARTDNTRVLQALSGLTGTTITLLTKTAQRYEGVIGSTTAEGDNAGVTLKDVKEITTPGAPLKDSIFVAASNIESYTSGPADARPTNGDSFRTDTDISQQKKGLGGRERELQAWQPAVDAPSTGGGLGDEDTFGASSGVNGNTSWDQFTANEQLFGVKASFDEEVYTTKLDRSAPDFKDRERKAQKLANEIIGATTNNPHIAEERGATVDDSGLNEEDKYGAVVRGQNAYVPPGARKPGAGPPPPADNAAAAAAAPKPEVPKVSINGPDGTPKTPSPAPANKPPADPLPAFRDFVTNEKQRLTQKRQAMVKNEMDKRMAELVKFSQSFKLNKPIPEDLVPILAKDEEKQRVIKEKAKQDASSNHARAIGPSTPATASRGVAVAGAKMSKPVPAQKTAAAAAPNANGATATAASGAQKLPASTSTSANATPAAKDTSSKKIPMLIQNIPPFRGGKGKMTASSSATPSSGTPLGGPINGASMTASASAAANTGATSTSAAATNGTNGAHSHRASPLGGAQPVSPNTAAANANAAARLNVNASSFRPNTKANAAASPKPSGAVSSNVSSPKPKDAVAPGPPNPFFGARPIKKSTPVNVKDDFNPFKHNKIVDASQVAALWPYSGKRYMQMFPPLQHPPAQQQAHMPPAVPPPIPPPSYEEDSAAQAAAARGYVYAYPPYGYPPPHMMQGMPPGPPGAYMPGPYMQHMPYPPGMPPPNAMYSPGMGQMPPPQAYMQQPPPGAYPPPPPNGAGPRPSMPPTPIPAHAHPYYHQSPQSMVHFDQYSGKMMFTMPSSPRSPHAAPHPPAPPHTASSSVSSSTPTPAPPSTSSPSHVPATANPNMNGHSHLHTSPYSQPQTQSHLHQSHPPPHFPFFTVPHAYPMMMPPPPNMAGGAPPHGYEGAQPPSVQMGGHA